MRNQLRGMKVWAMSLLGVLAISMAWAGPGEAMTKNPSDSVIVNFGTGGKMVAYFKTENGQSVADEVNFNELVERMKVYVDSARNTEEGVFRVSNEWGDFLIYAEERSSALTEVMGFEVKFDHGLNINLKKPEKDNYKAPKHSNHTDLYFGLNNFIGADGIPEGTGYDLRPAGARFFELAFRRQARIGGEKTRFFFNYAISFSWNNFMFEGNRKITSDSQGQVAFVEHVGQELKKSKLTVAYVNVPLMVKFKHKKFSLAAGGYVGYRLGSHSKIKYLDEGGDWQKDKEHRRFGLKNVRYGLRAEIDWIGPTIFANYDINDLFSPNSGAPELNAISFGIRL